MSDTKKLSNIKMKENGYESSNEFVNPSKYTELKNLFGYVTGSNM